MPTSCQWCEHYFVSCDLERTEVSPSHYGIRDHTLPFPKSIRWLDCVAQGWRDFFNFAQWFGGKTGAVIWILCSNIPLVVIFRPGMKEDTYYVRLNVDGEDVPIVNHCRYPTDWMCRFQVRTQTLSCKGLYRVWANFGPPKLLSNFWEIVGINLKYRMFNTSWNMTLFKICTWFRYMT